VLNQFPRNFMHVSMLSCEYVPIFLEKFDERGFLFRIQIIAYVSNFGRLLRRQRNHLVECVLRLDGRIGLDLRHDRVWGGMGCFNSWSYADAVSLSAVSQLSLSQSKARLMSPLMEMTPHGPGIFKTK
jgi:hypothetical protein